MTGGPNRVCGLADRSGSKLELAFSFEMLGGLR